MLTLAALGVTLESDFSRLERRVESLAKGLEAGFPTAMHRTGQLVARTIDLNITSARGMKPLAPATVKARANQERRGKPRPVAGNTAQLRNQDNLRKALTATRAGVPGTAYKESATEVTVGADTSYESPVNYALTATGLNERAGKVGIPVRDPTGLSADDARNIKDYVATDIRTLVRKGL